MNNQEPQPIIVTGEDAEIVSRFYALKDALQRQNDAVSPQYRHPVTVFQTEEEEKTLRQFEEVVEKYRRANNLRLQPQLFPVLTQPVCQPAYSFQQRPFFYECKHDKPTDLEMAHLLLHRRHLRVWRGSVYLYNGQFYRKQTDDQLKKLILEVLRQELEIDGSSRQLASVAAAIVAEPTIEISEERIPKGGCA